MSERSFNAEEAKSKKKEKKEHAELSDRDLERLMEKSKELEKWGRETLEKLSGMIDSIELDDEYKPLLKETFEKLKSMSMSLDGSAQENSDNIQKSAKDQKHNSSS